MSVIKVGSIIDERYLVSGILGSGGMGAVYLAKELNLERELAIKVINSAFVSSEESLARFRREADVLAQLRHKNLVNFYRYGIWHDLPYIVLERVEGEALDKVIASKGNLPPAEAVSICLQIAEALAFVHKNGVVHRDLKPANIIVNAEGQVKLLDFGLCGILEGQFVKDLTESGLLLGSVNYMSPEICTGQKADQRADIYATGIILFQMLTGRLPFEHENPVGLLYKHANEAPPTLKEICPLLPMLKELDELLSKCLAKRRDDRFASGEELHSELERIASEMPESALVAVAVKTNRKKLSSILTLVLLASGLLIFFALLTPSTFARILSIPSIFMSYERGIDFEADLAKSLAVSELGSAYANSLISLAMANADKHKDVLMEAYLHALQSKNELKQDKDQACTSIRETLALLVKKHDELTKLSDRNKIDDRTRRLFAEICDNINSVQEQAGKNLGPSSYKMLLKLDGLYGIANPAAIVPLLQLRLKSLSSREFSPERSECYFKLAERSVNLHDFQTAIKYFLLSSQQHLRNANAQKKDAVYTISERSERNESAYCKWRAGEVCADYLLNSKDAKKYARETLKYCTEAQEHYLNTPRLEPIEEATRCCNLSAAKLTEAKLHTILEEKKEALACLDWYKTNFADRQALKTESPRYQDQVPESMHFINNFMHTKATGEVNGQLRDLKYRWGVLEQTLEKRGWLGKTSLDANQNGG